MERIFAVLFAILLCTDAVAATTRGRVSKYVDPQSYAYMYPYLNNKMRTEMNPGTTVNMVNNPIDVVVKTKAMPNQRRVVPRTAKPANSATTAARTATTAGTTQSTRRVVPRTAKSGTTARAATNATPTTLARSTTRGARDGDSTRATETVTTTANGGVSSSRCLADYTACMNGYCERENAAYNRCYCSAKLAQIDSQYQPTINELILQIINLRGGGTWTESEMNEYWMSVVGNYAGENSWTKLDNALNIDWPEPSERMRGQNAFIIGHQYCMQHLRACAYMSSNLRDAYRSQISRDCATYENSLERLKTAAEAVIEHYSE